MNVDLADFVGNRVDDDPGIPMGYVTFKNGVRGYLLASGGFEFEVSGSKGKLRTLNDSVACQWRKIQDEWNILEEVPFLNLHVKVELLGRLMISLLRLKKDAKRRAISKSLAAVRR